MHSVVGRTDEAVEKCGVKTINYGTDNKLMSHLSFGQLYVHTIQGGDSMGRDSTAHEVKGGSIINSIRMSQCLHTCSSAIGPLSLPTRCSPGVPVRNSTGLSTLKYS